MATSKRSSKSGPHSRSPKPRQRPRRRGPVSKSWLDIKDLRVNFDGTNDSLSHSQAEIAAECDRVKGILLKKNRAYGDSALDPVRIFSKASAEEQILVRLDDKLSRIARGQAAGEDVTLDLIGYLVLLRVARARRVQSEDNATLDVVDDELAKARPKRRR